VLVVGSVLDLSIPFTKNRVTIARLKKNRKRGCFFMIYKIFTSIKV
jgi:hypothetical protein